MPIALGMPKLQCCCLCVSLRTGAKIFGFISLVGGLLLAVLAADDLFYYLSYNSRSYRVAEVGLVLFLQIVHLVTSFLLLLGVYQENRKLIPPWLVTTVLVAVSELFLIPSSILSQFIMEFTNQYSDTSVSLVILDLLDEIYGFLVVYSYYRTLPLMDANPV